MEWLHSFVIRWFVFDFFDVIVIYRRNDVLFIDDERILLNSSKESSLCNDRRWVGPAIEFSCFQKRGNICRESCTDDYLSHSKMTPLSPIHKILWSCSLRKDNWKYCAAHWLKDNSVFKGKLMYLVKHVRVQYINFLEVLVKIIYLQY